MTELFETWSRILELGRRLFAAPPQAELPPAYLWLLRDPSDRLEELWSGTAYTQDKIEERISLNPTHFISREERAILARTGSGATADEPPATSSTSSTSSPSWLLSTPANVAQTYAPASQAVPLRLSESRPTPPPASRGEVRTLPPSSKGAAPSFPRPELPRGAAATAAAPEPYATHPAVSETAPNVVVWPTTRTAAAGTAELATPGNVLQEREEELSSDPELLRLREQLEVEEGKRRLRQEWPQEVSGGGPEVSRPYADPAQGPAAQTTTNFSPVAQLLSKNVARAETAAAPREPEVLKGVEPPPAPRRVEEETRVEGAGRAATAPLVEEVLEELYERLRLEFSRTYGTTGG